MRAAKKAALAKRMEAAASKAPVAVRPIVAKPERVAAPLTVAKRAQVAALLMEAAVRPATSAPVTLVVWQKRKQLRV